KNDGRSAQDQSVPRRSNVVYAYLPGVHATNVKPAADDQALGFRRPVCNFRWSHTSLKNPSMTGRIIQASLVGHLAPAGKLNPELKSAQPGNPAQRLSQRVCRKKPPTNSNLDNPDFARRVASSKHANPAQPFLFRNIRV